MRSRALPLLMIAALCAPGRPSILHSPEIVDRGYERVDEKLGALGADIVREP